MGKEYKDERKFFIGGVVLAVVTNTRNDTKYFKFFSSDGFHENEEKCFAKTARSGEGLFHLEGLGEFIESVLL